MGLEAGFVVASQISFLSRLPFENWKTVHRDKTVRGCQGVAGLRGNALEESKRKSKSPWNNIPNLHEQYIRELQEVERKYGPKKMKKNIAQERGRSILAPTKSSFASSQKTNIQTGADFERQRRKSVVEYQKMRRKLLRDTAFLGALGCCAAWGLGTLRAVGSYALGVAGSLVYLLLLSRTVDRLADSAKEDGKVSDGLQPARIALLCIIFLAIGRNREHLDVLPVVMGFFTYKIATILPLITGEAFED